MQYCIAFLKLHQVKRQTKLCVFACLPFSEKSEKMERNREISKNLFTHNFFHKSSLHCGFAPHAAGHKNIYFSQIGVSNWCVKTAHNGRPFWPLPRTLTKSFLFNFFTCGLRCAHIAISRKARFVLQPHNAFKGIHKTQFSLNRIYKYECLLRKHTHIKMKISAP